MNRPEDIPERVRAEASAVAAEIGCHWHHDKTVIARAILAAEKRVREECAQKADGYADLWRSASVAIAAAIRKGGEDA